jgi:hypothetical protein
MEMMTPEEITGLPGRIATCLRDAASKLLNQSTVVKSLVLATLAPLDLTPFAANMSENVGGKGGGGALHAYGVQPQEHSNGSCAGAPP